MSKEQKESIRKEIITYVDFGMSMDNCLNELHRIKRVEELSEVEFQKFESLRKILNKISPSDNQKMKKSPQKYSITELEDLNCPLCLHKPFTDIQEHLNRCVSSTQNYNWPKSDIIILWRELECKACEMKFADFQNLDSHIMEMHPQSRTMFCLPCSLPVIRSAVYYKHHTSSALHKKMTRGPFSKVLKNFSMVLGMASTRCNSCSKTIQNVDLHLYKYNHNGSTLIWCKVCDVAISFSWQNLLDHARSHRHQSRPWWPILCPLCGFTVVGKDNFKKHVESSCSSNEDKEIQT